MTIEEMCRRKEELGLTYEQLAMQSGVPLGTVQKVLGGITKSPRYDTLQALEKVLKKKETKPYPKAGDTRRSSMLGERPVTYGKKRQGEYTLDDYYKIPDERRVELIDGVIYDMSSPSMIHQLICGEIYAQLRACILKHGMDCIPFIAPADVQLDCDNRTMLQPDVFVVCDRSRILGTHIYGAPDFTVEILSKSTRLKDLNLKTEKYRKAGVKEYWMVDPDKQKVIVHTFGDDQDINIYGFKDKIPVSISEVKEVEKDTGKPGDKPDAKTVGRSDGQRDDAAFRCVIDFAQIYEYIKFLLDK